MKELRKTIKVPMYGSLKIQLMVLENFDAFAQEGWPDTFHSKDESNQTHALNCLDWPKAWLVFRLGEITHGCVSHEIHQLTLKIMRAVGMIEAIQSEEAYSYFDGWLTDEVYRAFSKHGISLDKKKKRA